MSTHVRRVPVACIRCRKRKTKCLGGVPCRSCATARHDCIYPAAEKKILVPVDYLLDLEARVKAYESEEEGRNGAAFEGVNGEGNTPQSSTSQAFSSPFLPSSSEPGKDDIDKNPLVEGTAQLVLSPEGEQQYLGDSSSTSLGLRFRDLIKTFRSGADAAADDEPPTHRRSSLSVHGRGGQQSNGPTLSLPPFDFAKRLYAAQYAYIGTIFNFTDPESFEENLRGFCNSGPDFTDRNSRLSYCQTLLVLAFGQMYSVNQWTSHDGPPGFGYFQQALQLLPDIHEQGSVIFVEVLSLIGYFFQNLNLRDVAFLYIGLALRMAISLGLHQEVPDQHLDARAREHRRRAWWSVYSMDRILCVKSGNPLTIADQDIGVLPPSRLLDEPENCPATVLYHYTELSRILGKIMKNVYRRKSATNYNLVTSVQSILTDLSDWHMNLPRRLQVDFTKLDEDISREVISIYLHYNQCINMTARPLVFHVVRSRLQNQDSSYNKTDWRNGLSPTTIAVIDTCISAARNSIAISATAAKQNIIATYGYMDGEHLFSAAIILVMVNIAFPQNARDRAAMELALDVMKGIAEKGNSHIKSLHRLLVNLSRPTEKDCSQDYNQYPGTPEVVKSPHDELEQAPSPTFLSQNDLIAGGYLDLNQSVFQQDETGLIAGMTSDADARIWEEGYGIFDVNMDFDWTQWSNQ